MSFGSYLNTYIGQRPTMLSRMAACMGGAVLQPKSGKSRMKRPITILSTLFFTVSMLTACSDAQQSETPTVPNAKRSSRFVSQTQDEVQPKDPAEQEPGVLTGRVVFVGDVPPPRRIQVNKDEEHCGHAKRESQNVVVSSEGGLSGVVVEIRGIPEPAEGWQWQHPKEGYVIRQKSCCFHPQLLVVPNETELTIFNDDPVTHNINTGQWNVLQASGTEPMTETIRYPDPHFFHVSCNIHSWMESWIYVAQSPYHAVTGKDGTFRIDNIPPGKYRVEARHPTLRKKRFRITVHGGKTVVQKVRFE